MRGNRGARVDDVTIELKDKECFAHEGVRWVNDGLHGLEWNKIVFCAAIQSVAVWPLMTEVTLRSSMAFCKCLVYRLLLHPAAPEDL